MIDSSSTPYKIVRVKKIAFPEEIAFKKIGVGSIYYTCFMKEYRNENNSFGDPGSDFY
jgi:hypothetical protein